MTDPNLVKCISGHLDDAAGGIDAGIAERLRAARESALAVHGRAPAGAASRVRSLFGSGGWRPALGGAALLIAVVMLYPADTGRDGELAGVPTDVDTALLLDELPLDAYLDPDFRAWLLRDS